VSSNDEQSSVEPDKTEMTLEDVEKLSRMIAGHIRNEVLEYIHQHITNEEMGQLKDRIRGCAYAVLHGFFVTKASRKGLDLWWEMLNSTYSELHPFDVTAYELDIVRRTIAGEDASCPPQGEQEEEQKQANARRQAAFSRKGPFSTKED
jgi:hypothetical protein